ncbi:endonuclease/exonuclease/phosphatase family protein [Sunxiuqinia sp. sy24]|uniref:endonuclease/exonuclease/phosphatase family protein n=1 Tax=Sunxiuqinia sp. sy24 TaxID=3461495 RepID=UPI0040452BB8
MRKMKFWVVLLFFFMLIAACQPEKLPTLKIAAYNVEYSKNATAGEIGRALKSFDFDVVCFSEAPGGDWTQKVGAALGLNYSAVGEYSTAGHEDKYKTIVSGTPLYDLEEVLMADTLHTATKAKTRINQTEISIYAVHFPFGWRDQAHIDETNNKIATFVSYLNERQEQDVSVVAGDFNFVPSNADDENPYHELFRSIGLDVSWKALGIDCTTHNTYDAFNVEDQGSGEVIDHIMYNPAKMKALEGGIIEMEVPMSDHKPVWTLLQMK